MCPEQLDVNTIYPNWTDPVVARHNVRVIADQEGLTTNQKNLLSQTLHCESGYNVNCVHANLDKHGKVVSTDYGIAQINDFYHIGEGKDFPSVDYVMTNPEACVRWMAKLFKTGAARLWVCYSSNLYEKYSA